MPSVTLDKTGRIPWIDTAKALAMFFVVLGHLSLGTRLQAVLYCFHVPAFFFLSGYCFKTGNSFKSFFVKKIKGIVVPYYCFGIVALVIFGLYERILYNKHITVSKYLMSLLLGTVKVGSMRFNYHLWFLPVLFLLYVAFYFIVRLLSRLAEKTRADPSLLYCILSVVLIVLFCLFAKVKTKSFLPFGADTALRLSPFFSLGISAASVSRRMKEPKAKKRSFLLPSVTFVLSALVFAVFSYKNIHIKAHGLFRVNYMRDSYGNTVCFMLAAISGIALLVLISRFIPRIRPVEYFGRNTLPVLLMQKYPIMLFRLCMAHLALPAVLEKTVLPVLAAPLAVAVCLVLDLGIKKTVPFVYGMSKEQCKKIS